MRLELHAARVDVGEKLVQSPLGRLTLLGHSLLETHAELVIAVSDGIDDLDENLSLLPRLGGAGAGDLERVLQGQLGMRGEVHRDVEAAQMGPAIRGDDQHAARRLAGELRESRADRGLMGRQPPPFDDQIELFASRITDLTARLARVQARLYSEFYAMEEALAKLQTQREAIENMPNYLASNSGNTK